jgi:tetratricopeptide (TPR) repeat protein
VSPRPLIFISAVSQELRSARQLVANTLTFLGYDPIWQDIFETSEGDLRGVLRRQISRCNGVVQLVGCCYGAEPQSTEEFGRVSYTQYEALYARKIGKKVWYLFLDEHFPSDACVDEPEELCALQTAYRNRLKADAHLYHPLTSLEGLEASVLKLRGDLIQLRKGAKRWAAGVAIILLAGLAVNFWLLHWQRRTSQQMTETQQEMARLREGIIQYVQVEGKIREAQTETGLVRDQVYEQLGKQMNMNVALLREKLPQAAEKLKDAPTATLFERASAAYVANDYQEAERLALQAAVQARNTTPTNNADVIRALKLAGFAAQKQIKYATAMAHLREAAELTNRERDPGQWAEIQHAIADVLIDQGQYREAATVLQGALEARASAFGPENPDTLRSRNRLAYVFWRQGRYRDAEGEFRKLIAVEERLLGAQHPETLASENGLANALDDEGKHGDAESEHRRVFELRSKVLGPENPETLKSRNNLALAVNRQQKYAEAEKQFRELIKVEERVLGPEHPETLRSRRNLLVAIGNQGRHAEAETGFRDLLAIEERVLGPEHPDTLGVRNNIGFALAQQMRFADAEAQLRDVIKIEAKVLGPEHPATLSSRMALAGVLNEQQKYGEADAQSREVIALEEKVLGADHPSTISSWYAFAYQLARENKTEEALQFARKAASAAEQVFGQDHPDTRKYARLVQQLESQQPGADQASVKPVKAGGHEYTAAEARKHIGERATIVGKVDCIDHGRRHVDLQIGGCDLKKALVWIVVPNEVSGPELDPEQVRNVMVAVTGKIESSGGTPQITIKSTTQIQPRSALQTNYIGHAYDKEMQGDFDGAMEDLEQAIEHQPARRDEACEHLARVKEKRGDWAGALAAYDRLVALDPNKSGSYYVRATAKKQHGDFEAAMTDFTRAAELRSSGINLVEIGNMRKANGDSTGAMAEYNKAIAMLDSQIAGVQKPSDRLDLLYYHRGYAKELKGDVDGAVADYSQAIATKPSYGAGAYSRRGDIKKARGDLAGAIADYQYAVKYAQLNEDKEKLNKAKAEAKTRTKNVATQPNIQVTQNEQSFNKSEVTPEPIAEAFVQAYSGADVDALAGLYGDRVDYTNSGVISNAAVRAQAKEYFARWPVRQWSLVGPVKTISLGTSKKKVIFSATYDASDPQTNKHASGIATETLILVTDPSGAIKIISQKEQISKGNTTQPGGKTSEDPRLKAVKAEASKKQSVANPSQTNAPAQAQTGSPNCTSDPKSVWSEASPDKRLLATIRFVPNPDQNCRACDELKITVFRPGRDGKPGQILASTAFLGCFLQCAHWSPDSQFLLFTTSLSRGAHGGWHFQTFVYCAGDHSFKGDLEDVFGNVLAPDFRFESPDVAVLTVADDQAPSTAGEETPTKQLKVSLSKVVDKLDRLR